MVVTFDVIILIGLLNDVQPLSILAVEIKELVFKFNDWLNEVQPKNMLATVIIFDQSQSLIDDILLIDVQPAKARDIVVVPSRLSLSFAVITKLEQP